MEQFNILKASAGDSHSKQKVPHKATPQLILISENNLLFSFFIDIIKNKFNHIDNILTCYMTIVYK